MERPDCIPEDYDLIKPVTGYLALRGGSTGPKFARFDAGTNCYLWTRSLQEDFNALSFALHKQVLGDYADLTRADLERECLLMEGSAKKAAEFIIEQDMGGLKNEAGKDSFLRVIEDYSSMFLSINGEQPMHGDGTVSGGQVLAGYTEPMTRWLRNDQAVRMGGIYPAYSPLNDAEARPLPPGSIWCHASATDNPIHPFIHDGRRALKKTQPRLLLVGT